MKGTTVRTATDATARFDYEVIELPGRHKAEVLTGCGLITSPTAASTRLPASREWMDPLTRLVTNRNDLPCREMLKVSKNTEVFRTRLEFARGPIDVICKYTDTKGLPPRLASRLLRSRARRNRDRALELLHAGISTALPLALIERTAPAPTAWLVTEAIPDAVDLDQVIMLLLPRLSAPRARAVKKALTPLLVELLHRLESHNLHHRDLKASNFLITNWDAASGEPRIWIVDLDGLGPRRRLGGRAHWRPVVRLAASLLGYRALSRTDYVRFLHAYLARRGARRDDWKHRFHSLEDRAGAYVRRAQRRKRHKLDGYAGDD